MTLRIQASSGGAACARRVSRSVTPCEERHHHVGGAVVFPEAVDLDQRRMVEPREQPRLVDERAQADRVGFGERARAHRDLRPGAARRQRRRHVLLERDLALERVVAARGRRCRSRPRRSRRGSRTRRSRVPGGSASWSVPEEATAGLLQRGRMGGHGSGWGRSRGGPRAYRRAPRCGHPRSGASPQG